MIDLPVKCSENTPSSEFAFALLQKTHEFRREVSTRRVPLKGEGFTNAYTTILEIELFYSLKIY